MRKSRQSKTKSSKTKIIQFKYKLLTSSDVLPKKESLEKAAIIKRFEYSSWGSELKNQTSLAEK